MSSRSKASTSSWLALVVVLAAWIVLIPARAEAERRRVVVLELEGPKGEKFHSGLVKLIKKSHTVVPVDKWNETAEELGATRVNDKDIKKVAKKLKIDAVVFGKVDKRRDEYILQLKVRSGKTGEIVGNRVDVKAEEAKVTGSVKTDLQDELLPVISGVPANRGGGGGGDDEGEGEDKPKGFGKKPKVVEEEEEEAEEPKPKKAKKPDPDTVAALKPKKVVEEEEDDAPLPKPKKVKPSRTEEEEGEEGEDEGRGRTKKVASSEDDVTEEGVEEEGEVEELDTAAALAPGERAVDLVAGLSLTQRSMKFNFESGLGDAPPPYTGVPVAGGMIDATIYPLAIGHKRTGFVKNLGLTVMYDKVLRINSKQGDPPVTLPTSQSRFALGAAVRYPLGKATVTAAVRYGKQAFTISAAGAVAPAVPSVSYTVIDPMLGVKYQIGARLVLNVNLGFMLITNTGAIQDNMSYGAATVSGIEGEAGIDYLITDKVFVRAAARFSTIGFTFKGTGDLSNNRDGDAEQDVFGARDTYLGGALTAGFLY